MLHILQRDAHGSVGLVEEMYRDRTIGRADCNLPEAVRALAVGREHDRTGRRGPRDLREDVEERSHMDRIPIHENRRKTVVPHVIGPALPVQHEVPVHPSSQTVGKTTDEVRRQRRMLSNRESARRSRRRKLEHVATLEGQINQHKAENLALLERLRESEARVEAVVRENAQLKAEIVRMSEVAGAGGKPMERASSLQRIASAGNLAKSNLGGTASPQMSGDDSPRGFVPFRSLQSYENLLSLQAQGR